MNTTTLTGWGNGQGIRLSKTILEQAGLRIGDELDIHAENGRITLTPIRNRYVTIPDYAAMFRGHDGRQPSEDGFAAPAGRETM